MCTELHFAVEPGTAIPTTPAATLGAAAMNFARFDFGKRYAVTQAASESWHVVVSDMSTVQLAGGPPSTGELSDEHDVAL